MGFRTLEISNAAEIHIKEGQLEVTTDEGVALIPIEDLVQIMVHGAKIRLSTMDLSILAQHKVSMFTLDEKYLPTAVVLPFQGHSRQAKLMHAQVLHNACVVDGIKVSVLTSINMMCESLKRIILNRSVEKIQLPIVLPIESMEGITE